MRPRCMKASLPKVRTRRVTDMVTVGSLPLWFPMPTYLITGANRGLGLEFARQLSTRKDDTRIIATAREVEKAADLARLVHDVVPLDVAEPRSIEKLTDLLKDRPIDVLINNAGI